MQPNGETDTTATTGEVVVDEPTPPRRIRQPIDLVRLALAVVGLLVVAVVAAIAVETAGGIEEDVTEGTTAVPTWITDVLSFVVGVAVVSVPIVIIIDQILRNRAPWILDLVLAGALGGLIASLANWAITENGPHALVQSLTVPTGIGERSAPLIPFLCGLAAFTSTAYHGERRWVLASIVFMFAGYALVVLAARQVGFLGLAATLLIGRIVGLSVRYAFGVPNTRPHGAALVAAQRAAGLDPIKVQAAPSNEEMRRYVVATAHGETLHVHVLDLDRQGAGFLYRLYRRLRLRSPVTRRATLSLHAAVEREVLMAYAARAAGVRTPPLVAAAPAGPDAAITAYEHIFGRRLDEIPSDEITDEVLADAWRQIAAARSRHLVLRGLTADQLLLDRSGKLWFLDVRDGEVAAHTLQLGQDVAQLLATTALIVGPDRAVAAAIAVLGPEAVADAVPLLQPIALDRKTRAQLRAQRILLPELREAVLHRVPGAAPEPVRLERVRPRTLITVIGGTIAAYYLLSVLGSVDIARLVTTAEPAWVVLTIGFGFLTFVGATIALMGFVPIRLSIVNTFLAQLASSFAKLVTPAAVGGVALNTRYVQKSGLRPAVAVASIGVAQVFAFIVTAALLLLFGFLSGTGSGSQLVPSEAVVTLLVIVGIVIAIAMAIRPIRRRILNRVRPTAQRVLPRLLDVLQNPARLAMGIGGNLLLTAAFVFALDASVRAFGGSVSPLTLVVIYLAGSAVGAAAPTPGGLGAVEATMAAALTATGLTGQTAVSAVLLFRVATFWLPVVPGWLAFQLLHRRNAL